MRTKEQLVNHLSELMLGVYDRFEAIEKLRHIPTTEKIKLEKWATKIVKDVTKMHRTYFFVIDRLDAAIASPKPKNVHTLRPRRRR